MENPDPEPHGVEDCLFNVIGGGWQISCLCGWVSGTSKHMEWIGLEFDDHLREVGIPL
jgi:hypothetical protein